MLSKNQFGTVVIATLLLAACSNTYNRAEMGGTERTGVRLNDESAVLVTTPRDGSYEGKVFSGSGVIAARTINASFSRYARIVDIYPSEYHSINDLSDVIAKNGYAYIVVPTISVWARKSAEWSKYPSQINVKIIVIDAGTGKEISANFLEAKSEPPESLSTLFDAKPDGPEDLLADLTDDYTDNLYGALFSFPSR